MLVELPHVRGLERTSDAFRRKLVLLSDVEALNPGWLAAVMSTETARTFSPSIQPPGGSAVGLIQFMPQTARALGTTTAELKAMTAEEQLDYVQAFFRKFHAGRNLVARRPVDTYLAIFAPAHIGKPMSSVIYAAPSKEYEQNKGLDPKGADGQRKGYIVVADVDRVIQGTLRDAEKRPPMVVQVYGAAVGWGAFLGTLLIGSAAVVALHVTRR